MRFFLRIMADKDNPDYFEIDYDNCDLNVSGVKDFSEFTEYNDLLSKIVFENSSDVKYLLSDTLNRLEGRTHFYDKLSRYLRLAELIEEKKQNLKISNLDYIVFKALIKLLKSKGAAFKYDRLHLGLFEAGKQIRFILKICLQTSLDLILWLSAKMFLAFPKSQSYDYLFLSFYDHRCSKNGDYCDSYFQPLIVHARSKAKTVIVFSTALINEKPWKLAGYLKTMFKYVGEIRRHQKTNEIQLFNQHMSLSDVLRVYLEGLKCRVVLKGALLYKNRDIAYLTYLSLRDDYFRGYWNYAYQQYYCFKNIFKKFKIGEILYPYENFPYEKLIIMARNEDKIGTKLLGFQHTSLSFKLLQHFPGKYEKDLKVYPDKILTVGEILKDIMNSCGHYPGGLVEAGCALRHPYLFAPLASEKETKRGFTGNIAYSFSFDTKLYPCIINNLVDFFENSPYTIYLKIHPLVVPQDVIKRKLPPNFIMAKYMDWQDLFRKIDLLFYDDNSLGIEALRYGVDVVYFGLTGEVYNCDRLFNYQRPKFLINSKDDLREFINDYYGGKIKGGGDDGYKEKYLRQYFLSVTGERMDRFLLV